MGPSGTRVPNGLDDLPRFLLWSVDVGLVTIVVAFCGALVNQTLVGALLGVAAGWGWHRLSHAHGHGVGTALLYWHVGLVSFRRTPPSARRSLIG